MRSVIDSRHSVNRASCCEKIVRDLHHRVEALGGQLAQASEETTLSRVYIDLYGEERVHEMHPSVQFYPN